MSDYSIIKAILAKRLLEEEGYEPKPYMDTTGHLSQGIGINLNAHPERKKPYMTLEDAKKYLNEDIDYAIGEIKKHFPEFESLNDARKVVLVDMAFNLGIKGLLEFKKMINYIKMGSFSLAAHEIKNSKAATQTGKRYLNLATIMELGKI